MPHAPLRPCLPLAAATFFPSLSRSKLVTMETAIEASIIGAVFPPIKVTSASPKGSTLPLPLPPAVAEAALPMGITSPPAGPALLAPSGTMWAGPRCCGQARPWPHGRWPPWWTRGQLPWRPQPWARSRCCSFSAPSPGHWQGNGREHLGPSQAGCSPPFFTGDVASMLATLSCDFDHSSGSHLRSNSPEKMP